MADTSGSPWELGQWFTSAQGPQTQDADGLLQNAYGSQPVEGGQWARDLGYDGDFYGYTTGESGGDKYMSPEYAKWYADQGFQTAYSNNPGDQRMGVLDKNGKLVQGADYSVKDKGNFIKDAAMLILGGYFGGSALAGSGAAGGAAGASAGAAGAGTADAMSAYLASGAAEGSTFGSALTGAGGASGAVGSGSLAGIGQGALAGAGKGALFNGGVTALQGGNLNDVLKSAAIGGVAGGIGGGVGNAYGDAYGRAAQGATGATLRGGSLSDIARGGVSGGLSSYTPDVGGYMGMEDGALKNTLNGSLRGGVMNTVNGGDFQSGAVMGGLSPAVRGVYDTYGAGQMPDTGTLGGTMSDMLGENSATLGGATHPTQQIASAQASNGEGGSGGGSMLDSVKSILGVSSAPTGFTMPNFTGQQMGDMAQGLAGLYSGYEQRKQAKNILGMVGGRRGAYETQLRQNLMRKDAASGRRSDYSGRETQLQASLAELDSRNAPMIAQLQQAKLGGLNSMLQSGLRLGGNMGWIGKSGSPADSGYGGQAVQLFGGQGSMPSLSNMTQSQGPSFMEPDWLNKNKFGAQ